MIYIFGSEYLDLEQHGTPYFHLKLRRRLGSAPFLSPFITVANHCGTNSTQIVFIIFFTFAFIIFSKLSLSIDGSKSSSSWASKVVHFHFLGIDSPLIVDQDHHHPEHQKLTLLLSESRSLAPAARSRYKGLPSTLYYNVFSVFCICVCIWIWFGISIFETSLLLDIWIF